MGQQLLCEDTDQVSDSIPYLAEWHVHLQCVTHSKLLQLLVRCAILCSLLYVLGFTGYLNLSNIWQCALAEHMHPEASI
jgi:hypothetical protein